MAFTFSTGADYPSQFDDCKALTIELFAAIAKEQSGSMRHLQLQFSLRVMNYRLAKHHCSKSWDSVTSTFITSFEFAFPELAIQPSSIRHKTCSCISEDEVKNNLEKAKLIIPLLQGSTDLGVSASNIIDDSDEALSSNTSEASDDDTTVINRTPDGVDDHIEQQIQFGDVDFEQIMDSTSSDGSDDLHCDLVPATPALEQLEDRRLVVAASAERVARNTLEPPISDDVTSFVNAAVVFDKRPKWYNGDIAQIAVCYSKTGQSTYELLDEDKRTISAFNERPTIEHLASILKPLAYSNWQIWTVHYMWDNMERKAIPIRDLSDVPSLALLGIISAEIPQMEKFFL